MISGLSGASALGIAGFGVLEQFRVAKVDTKQLAQLGRRGVQHIGADRLVESLHRLDEFRQILAKHRGALAGAAVRHRAMPDHADKQKQAARRAGQLDMFLSEILLRRVGAAGLRSGHHGGRSILGGKFMKADQRLAVHMKPGVDPGRELARIVKVPVGIVDMRLLPRRAREQPVRGERAKDELAAEDRAEHFHHQRMLHHVDKDLPLIQQVPDAALEVDLVGMLAMEMGRGLRLVGMGVDDPVGLCHLLGREDAFGQIVSRSVQQGIDGLVGTLVPIGRHLVHISIHSCAGSFLNFQIRFGPAMTLR